MVSPVRFDHLVVAVHDLEAAANDYAQLGFNVTEGGRHTHAPTRNALIYFEDGAYLELIEWLRPANGEKWYECLRGAGEGIVDFALCPQDIRSVISRTGGEGAAYHPAVPGSRVQPNGDEIRWQLGWATNNELPFLCADITPRVLRVREGACRNHPNGVKGIRRVIVGVLSLDKAVPMFERLLQMQALPPRYIDASQEYTGLRIAAFRLGNTDLLLAEPEPTETPAAAALRGQLSLRGPGAYWISLKAAEGEHSRLDCALTHGAAVSIGTS